MVFGTLVRNGTIELLWLKVILLFGESGLPAWLARRRTTIDYAERRKPVPICSRMHTTPESSLATYILMLLLRISLRSCRPVPEAFNHPLDTSRHLGVTCQGLCRPHT